MTAIRLLRHATLLFEYAGTTLLVDPMLGEAGSMPPIPNSPNDWRNPLVGMPDVDVYFDAMLVTHLHRDHLDDAAKERLPGAATYPVFCQPEDVEELRETGFEDVRPVEGSRSHEGITVTRTPARHGHGDLAERMGPVSGFVFEADGEPTVYHAGDTVWYEGVEGTLESHDPDVVVVNAGAAQFTEGRPITMTPEDVLAVCEHTGATVVADHMDAINHCRVRVPEDDERVDL
jgi:L-ascorbate metabolism protein UlaG (beta-lactamase superfamily)